MEKVITGFIKNKKHRNLVAVYGTVFLLIAICAVLILAKGTKKQSIAAGETFVLAYSDFSNSIGATGTVESVESTFVYSTLPNLVEEIYVEVGDYVEEGGLLAKLDDRSIADQIESQETNMRLASAGNDQTIKTARDNYEQFKYALEKGLNSGINSAESQVTTAYENYSRAIKTYRRYREGLKAGENTALINQEQALANARSALNTAEDLYAETYEGIKEAIDAAYDEWQAAEAALEALDPDDTNYIEQQEVVHSLEKAYNAACAEEEKANRNLNDARDAYNRARAQYNAALAGVDQTLADYAAAMDSAEQAYENALTNLEAARLAADNQLQSYANAISSAKTGADDSNLQVTLRQLKVTLNDTRVTAPTAGTITAVYAKTGLAGSGLLFVIEDINDLIIETSVKEYDIGAVTVGMPVTIKSNATGNDVYEGIITSIAPTSNKTSQGITDTLGEVEFATRVKVTSANTRLRIGMNVRLNYITEQQTDVLSVPYESVYTNQAGEHCILILEQRTTGDSYLIKELPVTAGLENDLVKTISGSGVSAGLIVIGDPDSYLPLIGKEVKMAG